MSGNDGGCIMANPDIAGIGVRVAIYAQNFIAPALAVLAFRDKKVDWKELSLVEAQSMSILLTACALLLSAVVQVATLGMSTYHALIVLNLAWMNNTNTFVYAILYRYQGVVPLLYFKNKLRTLPSRRKAIPLLIGSLHLSFVAGLGLWFWIKNGSGTFGLLVQCKPQLPIHASILGHSVLVTNKTLQQLSLALYGITVAPGVNVVIIVIIIWGSIDLLLRFLPTSQLFLPGYLWVVIIVGINVVDIIDTEIMIIQTRSSILVLQGVSQHLLQPGESQWTFGQTLALFLLILPLRDITGSLMGEQSQDTRVDAGILSGWSEALRGCFRPLLVSLRCRVDSTRNVPATPNTSP